MRIKPASLMNSESVDSRSPVKLDCPWCSTLGYRIDLVVENVVIVEVKSVEAIHPVHQAQILSYMRLSGIGVGLLINFNVKSLRNGIKRMVDGDTWEK